MKILITGTTTGIGRAIALRFLSSGHNVIGIDRLESSIEDRNYQHYRLDVRDRDNFPQLDSINIVINNAGTQNEDDININLRGVINITEKYAFQPNIKSVLMIGSASAHTGAEFPEYAASKGGLLAYTKNVAIRLAEKYQATCNSLDPGGVLTDLNKPVIEDTESWNEIMKLTPLKRWATPEEIADWAYFLTVTNKFCTAQNILVDGGEAANFKFVFPGY